MKLYSYVSYCIVACCVFFLFSCNQDEGPGGSSSIEGYVYNIIHSDKNLSFQTDTIPAVKEDVFLIYGDDAYFSDDTETGIDGLYRFDYLRKGDYKVYSLSESADGTRLPTLKDVKVSSGVNKADTIFIHTGKAYNTAMIQGKVTIEYWKSQYSKVGEGPAVGTRVFLSREGEDSYFEDVRVGDQGFFVFQKVLPGKYKIWTITEDPGTEMESTVEQHIEVIELNKVYKFTEDFIIKTKV